MHYSDFWFFEDLFLLFIKEGFLRNGQSTVGSCWWKMKLILSFVFILLVALCCGKCKNVNIKLWITLCLITAETSDDESFSCTPKEHFDKDCHACKCSATGTYAVCSGFICDPVNKASFMKAPENCKDGDKWSDGCNDCFCISKW